MEEIKTKQSTLYLWKRSKPNKAQEGRKRVEEIKTKQRMKGENFYFLQIANENSP